MESILIWDGQVKIAVISTRVYSRAHTHTCGVKKMVVSAKKKKKKGNFVWLVEIL